MRTITSFRIIIIVHVDFEDEYNFIQKKMSELRLDNGASDPGPRMKIAFREGSRIFPSV